MTKHELIKQIGIEQEISQLEAEKWVDTVFEGIKTGLISDGKVNIYKTLVMEVKDTNPSSGVINGKAWVKPAGKRISVKVADSFLADVIGE